MSNEPTNTPIRTSPGHEKLIEAFKGDPRVAVPLHGLESALVAVAGLHLVFLPWCLGGSIAWAQVVSLCIGLVALGLSLVTRHYTGDLAPQGSFRLVMWPRLVRFPIFWLGLVLFAYVAIQALNASWERVSTGIVWYIQTKDHIEWLPNGVDAPFDRMNAWRTLCIWVGAWALVCAIWTGLTRRSAVLALVNILVVSGVALAVVAIAGKMSGATKILWFYDSPARMFHGTFIYKNHTAGFLNLSIALSLAASAWHYVRGLRRLERSTPAPVYLFAAIVMGVAVFMSGSRAGMLLLAGMLIAGILIHLVWRARLRTGDNPAKWVGFAMGGGALAFIALATVYLNLDKSIEQIRNVWGDGYAGTVEVRLTARSATWDMAQDKLLVGWGAGSFRHVFPNYQQHYPEIWRAGGNVFFWDNAHNDYVQVLAELGLLGLFPLAFGLLWALARLVRSGGLAHPAFLLLLLGLGVTMAHGWVDLAFASPAVLTAFYAFWALLLRWIEFDRVRG